VFKDLPDHTKGDGNLLSEFLLIPKKKSNLKGQRFKEIVEMQWWTAS
jgi:hypothetical protein